MFARQTGRTPQFCSKVVCFIAIVMSNHEIREAGNHCPQLRVEMGNAPVNPPRDEAPTPYHTSGSHKSLIGYSSAYVLNFMTSTYHKWLASKERTIGRAFQPLISDGLTPCFRMRCVSGLPILYSECFFQLDPDPIITEVVGIVQD